MNKEISTEEYQDLEDIIVDWHRSWEERNNPSITTDCNNCPKLHNGICIAEYCYTWY
jgi:hypothetical protein